MTDMGSVSLYVVYPREDLSTEVELKLGNFSFNNDIYDFFDEFKTPAQKAETYIACIYIVLFFIGILSNLLVVLVLGISDVITNAKSDNQSNRPFRINRFLLKTRKSRWSQIAVWPLRFPLGTS